jgi:hypothetical protein
MAQYPRISAPLLYFSQHKYCCSYLHQAGHRLSYTVRANEVLREKLLVAQIFKQFHTGYEWPRFITFTTACCHARTFFPCDQP